MCGMELYVRVVVGLRCVWIVGARGNEGVRTIVPRSAAEAVIPRRFRKPCLSVLQLLLVLLLLLPLLLSPRNGSASPSDEDMAVGGNR